MRSAIIPKEAGFRLSYSLGSSHTERRKAYEVDNVGPELAKRTLLSDPSRPTVSNCQMMLSKKGFETYVGKVSEVVATAAPFSGDKIKRRIRAGGPVIGTIRLTWEFLNFDGSLFNPPGKQTFCRLFKTGDPDDFCDPRKSARWDKAQRDQQKMQPEGMSRDDFMETWYNHFVVLHGWGKNAGGVEYWVVENSWGHMYENDPSLANNGIGENYVSGRNAFLLIANRVAGAGGLEITSREIFYAIR
jgi:hypothetical protein